MGRACRGDEPARDQGPPRQGPGHLRALTEALEKTTPGQETTLAKTFHQLAQSIKRRSLVLIFSDLFDDADQLVSALKHFRHSRHEVIVFHVMDDAELTFPFDRVTRFKDMEGHGILTANPSALRARYLARIQQFQETLKAICFERKVSYELACTKEPYDHLLAAYLEKRSRLG